MENSNNSILETALGRPAMMGFMLLLGSYLITGQILPGWF
tara:strand:+ start:3576 stop:3695 length:120 start_codon:yes stop_codon:yes gene_type:complete